MAGKHKCPKGAPKWMTTFSDLVTLLLTFFVLLLSMANFDKVKIYQFLGVMAGGVGILDFQSQINLAEINTVTRIATKEAVEDAVKRVQEVLEDTVRSQNLEKMISIVKTDKGISIRIMDAVFFTTNSARLLETAKPILDKIIMIVEETPYSINVEGHTDDTPIGRDSFFNWELSSDRAVSVVRYFSEEKFDPRRLSSSGYGEYHPLVPNITSENRARNRRVEINLISPELSSVGEDIFQ